MVGPGVMQIAKACGAATCLAQILIVQSKPVPHHVRSIEDGADLDASGCACSVLALFMPRGSSTL